MKQKQRKSALSQQFKVGDRIIVNGHSKATVVSVADYDKFATPSSLAAFDILVPPAWKSPFASIDYVYLRWDKDGTYDWYWDNHCQLLPSSELAKEARVS